MLSLKFEHKSQNRTNIYYLTVNIY
uniref:Uncharacterized protein n=1 Tax=Lepeophtheirus salmonis TaxID=72036 RepID=A0A0K2TAZ5_LEPSM